MKREKRVSHSVEFARKSLIYNNRGDEIDPSIINEISSSSNDERSLLQNKNVIIDTECSDKTNDRAMKKSMIKSILESATNGIQVIDDFSPSNVSDFRISTVKQSIDKSYPIE